MISIDQNNQSMDDSRNLHKGPFKKFEVLANFWIFIFWTIPDFSHYEWFLNFHTIKESRIFTLLHNSELSHYGPIKNKKKNIVLEFSPFLAFLKFYLLNYSRIFTFWTIQELIAFWTIPKKNVLDHSRIFKLSTISDFTDVLWEGG